MHAPKPTTTSSHPRLQNRLLDRGPRRWLRLAVFLGWAVAPFAFEQAHAVPFYVHDVREVCQFPRAQNNGRVLGHDSGSSVLFEGKTYWVFADTLYDANNNGALDDVAGIDGFIGLGTVATTTDLDASDCMNMTYREQAGTARALFTSADQHPGDALLWPIGSVVSNGAIYVYSTAKNFSCASGSLAGQPCNPNAATACNNNKSLCSWVRYQPFLGKVDDATLAGTRLATQWPLGQEPAYLYPFKFSEPNGCGGASWVYLVGTKEVPLPPYASRTDYYLARVAQVAIEDITKYQYYNAATNTWTTNDPAAGTPIFDEYFGGQPSVAYNTYLGRWMMTYAGDIASKVLARTALVAGKTTAGLTGGWSDPVTLYECPGGTFGCYFPFQHPEYGDGSTIYITTSRNTPVQKPCNTNNDCLCGSGHSVESTCVNKLCTTPGQSRKYRMRLRAVTIGTSAPPAGRQLADAARDFTPNPRCDVADYPVSQPHDGWSYARLDGTTFTPLDFSYTDNWYGSELIGGLLTPNIEEDVMSPGTNSDVVRVWPVPGAGTVRISGEIRTKYNCSYDGVRVEWIRIRSGLISLLDDQTLSSIYRGEAFDKEWTVAAGDKIGLKVTRNNSSASCDNVDFAPTITYTP